MRVDPLIVSVLVGGVMGAAITHLQHNSTREPEPTQASVLLEAHQSFADAEKCRKSGRVAFIVVVQRPRFSVLCLEPLKEDRTEL